MISVEKVDAGVTADTVPLANMVPSQNPYGTSRPTYDYTSTEPSPISAKRGQIQNVYMEQL